MTRVLPVCNPAILLRKGEGVLELRFAGFLLAEGVLQKSDGTIAVKTDWLQQLSVRNLSHDFH